MFLETLLLITIVTLLIHIAVLIWSDIRTARRQEAYLLQLQKVLAHRKLMAKAAQRARELRKRCSAGSDKGDDQ